MSQKWITVVRLEATPDSAKAPPSPADSRGRHCFERPEGAVLPDDILAGRDPRFECAMTYVHRGWKVFVLGAGKTPVPNCRACAEAGPGHDPESCTCLTCHGFYAATLDPSRIEMMLLLHPTGHLAVRTGAASGIIVLDAEGGSDSPDLPSGVQTLDEWELWHSWSLPQTLIAQTPSGGIHLYIMYAEGVKSRNRVMPGVDVKADGGYVLLPCGGEDRIWLNELPLAAPSTHLLEWLRTAKGGNRGGSGPGGLTAGYDYAEFAKNGVPGGHRDEFFNDMCFRLRKAGATRTEAEAELRKHWERAAQPPDARYHMPWEHVLYKVTRVWRTVEEDPELPLTPTAGPTDPIVAVSAPPGAPEPDDRGSSPEAVVAPPVVTVDETLSDTGNARRFVRMFRDEVRYVPEWKRWLIWDQTRWVPDVTNRVGHMAEAIATDVRRQAELDQDNEHQRLLARHALSCESLRARQSAITIAGMSRELSLTLDDLNRDPLLLVVRNGVLDLRTGFLVEPNRLDFNTQCAAVTYDPEADAPRWAEHIRFITQNDPLLAAYLRRAVGYSLTGLTREQTFFMLEGTGANGKNAFIEPVLALMGDYAQTGTSALITGGDEQHPTILADLVGARLVFIDEARQGRPLNVERVKGLTGSRRIKARRMGQDFFEFDAHLKLWIAGNNHPTMRDPSDGVWRRLHRVLFNAKVSDEKKITDYGQLLFEEEAPGILNWAIEGLKDWQQLNGLGQPEYVLLATTELRDEEDLIKQFMEERLYVSGAVTDVISGAQLYTEYCLWAGLQGLSQYERSSRVQFGRELAAKGLKTKVWRNGRSTIRGYEGVQIVHP